MSLLFNSLIAPLIVAVLTALFSRWLDHKDKK
ncbi:type I toxin-antitoxin system Fst family toxin [Lactiplantibacillus plantarum]|nr:type I toxin-antitoxin system Fst family toxin [Lactiplantibacillus plantarum]MBU7449379.1 type I toxin-antitoxin system Fst family toxin [Lactiplantibacillus sp. 7.2.4]MBU7481741.1 type I toxin-antitoxin system Fst family toxin [Lactiplantibacillus pentosus]MEE2597783.1 type I toxin-antitoxin system Fst family toxin [Lactiplantibacillus plantarum subsp. plantarum]MBO3685267.1 type I toxin-antitoxin system Fst family toxin [Lactiplantibacillus plantarum]MCI3956299.1 type I toxin-antitoxin s